MADDVLYKKSYLNRLSELRKAAPVSGEAFLRFDHAAFAPGHLSAKEKELIATAVAHVTGCPYCIEVHVANCKKHGTTMEEIMEAVMVAASVKAGAALSHAVNALNAYDR